VPGHYKGWLARPESGVNGVLITTAVVAKHKIEPRALQKFASTWRLTFGSPNGQAPDGQ
jgi:hypothetical protein